VIWVHSLGLGCIDERAIAWQVVKVDMWFWHLPFFRRSQNHTLNNRYQQKSLKTELEKIEKNSAVFL
jgi:hypothetical protein